MSIANEQLAQDVKRAVEEWTPQEDYGHESKFQNDLQDYLDRRLNSSSGFGMQEEIVVEREHGTARGDVVVNGSVGIEMKRDLTNGQINTLRGQLEEYQSEYDYVLSVACGIEDRDGWRKLKNEYQHDSFDFDPSSAPVRFIHKPKSEYGSGKTASDYAGAEAGSLDNAYDADLEQAVREGVEGYRSLTGDGDMNTGDAIVAVAQLAFLIVVLFVLLGVLATTML